MILRTVGLANVSMIGHRQTTKQKFVSTHAGNSVPPNGHSTPISYRCIGQCAGEQRADDVLVTR
jgi:hypothetical protein